METETAKYTKRCLVRDLSESTGKTQKECSKLVDEIFLHLRCAIARHEEILIKHVGRFNQTYMPERKGRNPATGKLHRITSRWQIKFKASKPLKSLINPVI